MTPQEFSSEFDILYNNIMSNKAPGLDDYEKSFFLTQAQEILVLTYYNGNNPSNDSFEKTEEIRRYLDALVTKETPKAENSKESKERDGFYHTKFSINNNLWFITYESVVTNDNTIPCYNKNGKELMVIPVTQDNYYRIVRNPFRGPNDRRVLRLDVGKNKVEIVSKYKIDSYTVKYIKQPEPIILSDLPEGLSINNKNKTSNCELNPAIHRIILDNAVKLAIASYKE